MLAAALGWSPGAQAGIDAWTTTGPRAAWDVIGGDSCANSATIVGAFGRWARSTDAGSHWQLMPPPPGETVGWSDTIPGDYFTPLAIAADRAGSGALVLATSTGRLERSTDGGATWSELAARIPLDPVGYVFVPSGYEAHVRRVVVEGNRIFVAYGNAGLLGRSLDGGATIEVVGPPGIRVRDVDARGSRVVIGGDNSNPPYGVPRVWRSDDGGATWRLESYDFPIDGRIERVAISAGERVVALGFGHTTSAPSSSWLWTSDDGGLTFPVLAASWPSDDSPDGFREPEAKSLRVADCRPAFMAVRDGGTVRVSEDAGTTWRAIALTPEDGVLTAGWVAAASAGGLPSLMLATRNLGVTRSVDAGATFVPQNRGLPGAPQSSLGSTAVYGERRSFANASYRWNLGEGFYDRFGYRLLARGGHDNRWNDVSPDASVTFVLPPAQPGSVLAWSRRFGAVTGFRSTDGGDSWSPYGAPVPALTERIGGGIEDTGSLFAFGTFAFYNNRPDGYVEARRARSTDLGTTWVAADPEFVDTHVLAAARSPTTRVYSGRTPSGGTTAGFNVSNDGGVTWTPTPNPASWAAPFDPVDAIAVDPANGNHVIVAGRYGNRVFESTDGGATWSPLGAALPAAQGLALNVQWQRTPRRVLVGTTDGLYSLEGFGAGGTAAWTPIGATGGMRVAGIDVAGPAGRETFSIATDRGIFDFTHDAESATVAIFRFYNTQTSTHFYTASVAERDHVIATWPQFTPEGTAFHAIDAARTDVGRPVWRFFNTSTGTHFYTASADERAYVLATYPQFVDEGIVYRALPGTEPGTVKVFRFFNAATGAHFYTTEDDERAVVNQLLPTYADEGVVFAVYPAAPAP